MTFLVCGSLLVMAIAVVFDMTGLNECRQTTHGYLIALYAMVCALMLRRS